MGGAQKVAGFEELHRHRPSRGYGGVGGTAAFQIYAQAPNSRGVWINFPEHPDRGVSAWTYDGKTGWISQPRAYIPIYELTGNDLVGAKLDGVIGLPGEIATRFAAGASDRRTRSTTAKSTWCREPRRERRAGHALLR